MNKSKSIIFNYSESVKDPLDCLSFGDITLPELGENDVLIEIEASVFNPSDHGGLMVSFLHKLKNVVHGNEGVGIVVEAGKSTLAQSLIGKRVASFKGEIGYWSEHIVQDANQCVVVDKDIPVEQAATLIINPLTAVAIVDAVIENGCDSFIHNAGASQLGRMLIKLAKKKDLRLVNMVRREKQVGLLEKLGSEHTINMSNPDFEKQLKKLIDQYNIKVAFDAIAGKITGTLSKLLPEKSTVYVYGGLSFEPIEVGVADLIYSQKKIEGFLLRRHIEKLGLKEAYRDAQKYVKSGLFKTEFDQICTLEEAPKLFKSYLKNMTKGKVLVTPKKNFKKIFYDKLIKNIVRNDIS